MVTARLPQDEIDVAVDALRDGDLVAFPTETVYGLGADAQNPDAVRKVYEIKGRPATHPLIVHIDHPRLLERWALSVPPAAQALADRFWPGPLTLVLSRAPAVDLAITGGQDTVAVRVPAHPVAQQLLRAFGGGIAAPSANRYGHVSPTRADHVRDEFGDAVKVVLDGGDCKIGLESTIVSCVDSVPRLLRPGFITLSQLRSVVPDVVAGSDASAPRAPGSDAKHYAPATPLSIVNSRTLEEVVAQLTADHEKVAVLAMRPPRLANRYMTWINAGRRADVYARELYVNLRTLDKSGAKEILVEEVPPGESWDAVRDRLRRAASVENLVTVDPDIAALRADFGEDIGLP
ncbi:MAG TPA: L-threonylcarbamoyladenylate synthase [Steroidobacteraceae bacterium]|nr:L-threonylcarbamoyladenylate synthase [Steroidobacteraceae bacterium]